jgi:hypothetical protein
MRDVKEAELCSLSDALLFHLLITVGFAHSAAMRNHHEVTFQ